MTEGEAALEEALDNGLTVDDVMKVLFRRGLVRRTKSGSYHIIGRPARNRVDL